MQPRRSIPRSRELRSASTGAEQALWYRLRNRQLGGFKFRRQVSIPPYVVDFVCLERRLVVELDGGQHVEQAADDTVRTRCLETNGYCVLRFWNDDLLKRTGDVLEEILRALQAHPHPHPLPSAGEGAQRE
jgi:adenine-specific DNA-methyltransferase